MRRSLCLLAVLSALGTLLVPARAALDLIPGPSGDLVPDVWAIVNNFQGTNLAADNDGDGQTNGAEAAAGTNPNVSGDVIAIKSLTPAGSNITIVFSGIAGEKIPSPKLPCSPASKLRHCAAACRYPEASGRRQRIGDAPHGNWDEILPGGGF